MLIDIPLHINKKPKHIKNYKFYYCLKYISIDTNITTKNNKQNEIYNFKQQQ